MNEKLKSVKIFIPSKNRLENEKTYKILLDLGLEPNLVLEPQEEEKAKSLGFKYVILPDNNRGITYARNFILDYCIENNIEFAAMLDDDISNFLEIVDHKRVFDENKAFLKALEKFLEFKYCGTMQYNQFAWCQEKPIVYNRGLEVVFFLYIPHLTNIRFEEDTIEDRDFSIDLIVNHKKPTFRLNHLAFTVPSIGTNKGGIESSTRYQKQIEWSKKMEKKWGSDICKYVIKKNGTPDIKINWRTIDKMVQRDKESIFEHKQEEGKEILPKQMQFEFMFDLEKQSQAQL